MNTENKGELRQKRKLNYFYQILGQLRVANSFKIDMWLIFFFIYYIVVFSLVCTLAMCSVKYCFRLFFIPQILQT